MQRLMYALIVVALIAIAIRYSLPQSSETPEPPNPTRLVTGESTSQLPDFLMNQTPRVIPTPNPDAPWTERLSMSSKETNVRSEPFEIEGGLVRLRYTLGEDVTLLALSLIADSPEARGGLPEVMATRAGDAERLISRPPGRYRLVAQSIGGEWSVVIEEEQPVEQPQASSPEAPAVP